MAHSESPQPSTLAPQRVAVVGAGISGLAAAHRLGELLPQAEVHLLDSADRAGGILHTVREGDYLMELSADSFITKMPWGTDLCGRLGIADELLPTNATGRRALVVHRGKVVPVPEAFVLMSAHRWWPIVMSPVLSLRGKARLAFERFIPPRNSSEDESVASFVGRRLGREAFERLVQPLVAGIYTADPDRLSMQATLPQFVEQEQRFGSLWKATRQQRAENQPAESGARYGLFVAPRGGMQQLIDALTVSLPPGTLRTGVSVQRIEPSADQTQWLLHTSQGQLPPYDAVIVATPAYTTASMVEGLDSELAELLAGIEYAGASIVLLAVSRKDVRRDVDGFGFVVPRIENRRIIAASFANRKFPGRAPDGQLLVRVFVGGALQPEIALLDDAQLIEVVRKELHDLIGLTGEPHTARIARWPRSMPQYHVGHLGRVDTIERIVSKWNGLELAGNAYRGVGVPQCIHSGETAAERTAAYLGGRQ